MLLIAPLDLLRLCLRVSIAVKKHCDHINSDEENIYLGKTCSSEADPLLLQGGWWYVGEELRVLHEDPQAAGRMK